MRLVKAWEGKRGKDMQAEDREALERILEALEEGGFLSSECRLKRDDTGSLCLLGQGASGIVYEMQDTEGKSYALKVIGLGNHILEPDIFYDLAEEYCKISNDNEGIIHIIDAKEWIVKEGDGERIFVREIGEQYEKEEGIILQFVLLEYLKVVLSKDGKAVYLQREQLRDEMEICILGMQIGKALSFLHERDYVHRDVKLENIYWDENNLCYKLGDLDTMERAGDGIKPLSVFTDGYAAPEIRGRERICYEKTADIYSLGMCMYLLLNGLRFPASSGYFVDSEQYSENYAFPKPDNASEKLICVIQKMCSYNKKDRYQSMEEVVDAIQKVVQEKKEESVLIFIENSDGMEFTAWIPKMDRPA